MGCVVGFFQDRLHIQSEAVPLHQLPARRNVRWEPEWKKVTPAELQVVKIDFSCRSLVLLIKLSVFESFKTTKHRTGAAPSCAMFYFFLGWIHKNAFPDRISWGSYEASTSWRQRQVMCDVAQFKLHGKVWGNLPKVMTTSRPFKAWWSGIRIVKGSSWSWTQTWWAWWPWWAIVLFFEATATYISFIQQTPHGIDAFKKVT